MAGKRVVWDDFSGGERGSLASWTERTVEGLNMVPLLDGSLVPRSGVLRYELVDEPASGFAQGLGWMDRGTTTGAEVDDGDLAWFVNNDGDVYVFDPYALAGPAALLDMVDGGVGSSVHWVGVPGAVYMVSANEIDADGIFRMDSAQVERVPNTTAAVLTEDPGGVAPCLAIWRGFLLLSKGNRVYYSDGDFDTWPATPNYFVVGQSEGTTLATRAKVRWMGVLRGQLVIALTDGSWWMVAGDLSTSTDPEPLSFSVRQVTTGPPLLDISAAAPAGGGGAVWFTSGSTGWPHSFNGSSVENLPHLGGREVWMGDAPWYDGEFAGGARPRGQVLPLSNTGDLLIFNPGQASLLRRSGSWSRHELPGDVAAAMPNGLVLLCVQDDDGFGAGPLFYVWRASHLERPGGVDEDRFHFWTDAGNDGVGGVFTTSEWIAPDGKQWHARSVTVDFEVYDDLELVDGVLFEVSVSATRRAGYDGDVAMAETVTAVVASGQEAVEPGRYRRSFPLGTQGLGGGFQVTLSDVMGARVERVEVFLVDDGVRQS